MQPWENPSGRKIYGPSWSSSPTSDQPEQYQDQNGSGNSSSPFTSPQVRSPAFAKDVFSLWMQLSPNSKVSSSGKPSEAIPRQSKLLPPQRFPGYRVWAFITASIPWSCMNYFRNIFRWYVPSSMVATSGYWALPKGLVQIEICHEYTIHTGISKKMQHE